MLRHRLNVPARGFLAPETMMTFVSVLITKLNGMIADTKYTDTSSDVLVTSINFKLLLYF